MKSEPSRYLLSYLEAILRDLYLTFLFYFFGSGVSSPGNGSSSAPMGALGPTLEDHVGIDEFSGILEWFDSTYEITLCKKSKINRFATFSLGWGYAMAPWD